MRFKTAFFMAWGNFLAIPCPSKKWDHEQRGLMLACMPVVGLIVGLLWYGIWYGLSRMGIALSIKAAVLTAYPFIVSGLMHLDGFMDCCDAILSRKPMEIKQKILKDSNVGAFAVVSVLLLFLFCYASMCAQLQLGGGRFFVGTQDFAVLIFVPIVSRAMSARAVLLREPISHSQYADLPEKKRKIYGRACLLQALIAQIGAFLILWLLPGAFFSDNTLLMLQCFFAVFCITNLVHAMALEFCKEQLGGMSGDVSGFAITLSEAAAILVMGIV